MRFTFARLKLVGQVQLGRARAEFIEYFSGQFRH
jgi:hypothetical protein